MFHDFLQKAQSNPKILFVIDAIGAALSAFLLGIVLPKFQTTVGIPSSTLTFLASFPVLFLVFDMFAYKSEVKNIKRNLFLIATLNIFYVAMSIFFLWFHQKDITSLGLVYFIGELVILIALVYLQVKVGNGIRK